MKCSRCATEIADSAEVCPRCGTSVRSERNSTFSYLPAGAPPWPGTVPPLPYVVDAGPAVQTSAVDRENKARKLGRSLSNTAITLAMVILVPTLGVLATLGVLYANGQFNQHPASKAVVHPQSATQSTPQSSQGQLQTPTSFKTVKDSNLNVSFQYPGDWTAGAVDTTTDPINIQIQAPQQLPAIYVQHFSASASAKLKDANDLDGQTIQGFNASATGMQNAQAAAPPDAKTQMTIGGETWFRQDETFSNTNNVKFRFIVLSTQHKKIFYNIVMLMQDDMYQDAMSKDIQPMLTSVQFLS